MTIVFGYFQISESKPVPAVNNSLSNITNDPENLLNNPGLESPSSAIAKAWFEENDTAGLPRYYVTSIGTTDGSLAQRIEYSGMPGDDGKNKIEIFQAPVRNVHAGDTLEFTLYLSGSMTKTPAAIGIEGFNVSGAWIDESDKYITDISETPREYAVTYTCPRDTDYVAVYLQCQEINPKSEIAISMDDARLVRLSPGSELIQ